MISTKGKLFQIGPADPVLIIKFKFAYTVIFKLVELITALDS